MAHIVIVDPIVGQPDSSEEPKIPSALDVIVNAINGNLDATNIAASFAALFLKLATAGVTKIDFGTGTFTWPGGTAFSNSTTITLTGASSAHGVCAPFVSVAGYTPLVGANPLGGGQVQFYAESPPTITPTGGASTGFAYAIWGS